MLHKSNEEQLLWLLEISHSLLGTRDMEKLLEEITLAFMKLTGASRGILLLKDKQGEGNFIQRFGTTKEGRMLTSYPTLVTNLVDLVARRLKPVMQTDRGAREDSAARRLMHEETLSAVVCWPLLTSNCNMSGAAQEGDDAKEQLVGIIYLDRDKNKDEDKDAISYDLIRDSAQILANHAGTAIQNARMFERASNDPLTGLPNNSYFVVQLAKTMGEATTEAGAGVLLLDLDSFKRINAVAGAGMGDRALVDVATTLQDVLRADGLVARYGSDKFAILLPPDEEMGIQIRLRDVAERARACVGTKIYHGIRMTASIGGIAFPGPDIESAPDLIALADDQLARARARGPGEVEVG